MSYIGLNPNTPLLNTSTQYFSGNSVALQFALNRSVASASDLDVLIGNVAQRPGIDYDAEGTSLIFNTAPGTGTNNITVTFRGGALNTLNLQTTAFPAGTVGAPSVYSLAANNSGLFWANASSMTVTIQGAEHTVFNGDTSSNSYTTGALVVSGGAGFDGNVHANGELHSLATTPSTSAGTGGLLVAGGAGIAGNLNVGQNITCVGDFTVNGTFTTTGTDSLDVTDPFIFLANANPGDTYDSGVATEYNDGTIRYGGLFRDVTDGKWKLFGNLTVRPTTTVDTGAPSFAYEDLVLATVSATGNVTGNYILGNGALLSGIVTSVGNINNGTSTVIIPSINGSIINNVNGVTVATVSSTGVAVTGVVTTTGNITATGNVVGANVNTGGLITASGNVTSAANISGGNILSGGLVSAVGVVTAGGNVTGANLTTGGLVTAGGNVTGGNITTGGLVSAIGDVIGGNITTVGQVSATGNITGNYILGNGALLTGLSTSQLTNGTSNVRVLANGNVTIQSAGTANVLVASSTGVAVTGTLSASGNVTGANVNTAGLVSAGGNVTGGNITTSGVVTATGNISAGDSVNATGLVVATGNIVGGNVNTDGRVSATGAVIAVGNVTGGNINTGGLVSAIGAVTAGGNVTGANIVTGGLVTAIGSVSAASVTASGAVQAGTTVSATGNITGGNIVTSGLVSVGGSVSATGNVTGGNINTAGLVSATGNITSTANVAGANVVASVALVGASASVSGNIVANNAAFTNIVTAANAAVDTNTNQVATTAFVIGQASATVPDPVGSSTVGVSKRYAREDHTHTGVGNLATSGTGISTSAGTGNITVTLDSNTANSASTVVLRDSAGNFGANTITATLSGAATTATTVTGNAQPNINSLGVLTSLSVAGNVDGGNLRTAGLVSAAGSITGAGISGTSVSVSGNVDGGNINTGGRVTATGNINGGNVNAAIISGTGNVIGGNINTGGLVTATGNITSTANVAGAYVIGNGRALTSLDAGQLNTGTVPSAQISGSYTGITGVGTLTVGTWTANSISTTYTDAKVTSVNGGTGAITGLATTAGNLSQFASTTSAQLAGVISDETGSGSLVFANTPTLVTPVIGAATGTSLSVSGNVTGGNINTAGVLSVNSGSAATAIVNGGTNGVGNIGSATTTFNTVFAKATTAQYADLAENYVADANYAPGTVLEFGGDCEVTISNNAGSTAVAGVVSTNPAHLMNSTAEGDFVVPLALQGRVPTAVVGPVKKGSMMVSAGNGRAMACTTPAMGSVIGKALENFDGEFGTIEVVVGRL